jgi:hypothetical protein
MTVLGTMYLFLYTCAYVLNAQLPASCTSSVPSPVPALHLFLFPIPVLIPAAV